jgi:hypothetical protein
MRFVLPAAATVSLTVCDVTGRVVARPIENKALGAGEHAVWFRERELPAGIYLVSLRGQDFAETRKMVRVR